MLSNEDIINEKHKIIAKRPTRGTRFHYEGQRERYEKMNKDIREAFAAKRLHQVEVDVSERLRLLIDSASHFIGQAIEPVVMNYLLVRAANNGFKEMPQFSLNANDDDKDIIIHTPDGDRWVEVKGETPVFYANAISFPLDQKRKSLSADEFYVVPYGTRDGKHNWFCRVIWKFEPKTIPQDVWLDYPMGPIGRPQWRFGHGMGESHTAHTEWATAVDKVPQDIYDAICKASPSTFFNEDKFGKITKRKGYKDSTIPFPAFVRNQKLRHNV